MSDGEKNSDNSTTSSDMFVQSCVVDGVSSSEQQEARSFLRERFLRSITSFCNRPASFQLYENTKVQAEFGGSDIDVLNFYVRNLETPLGIQPSALLRTSDIVLMKINLEVEK